MLVFSSLSTAIKNGFQVWDHTERGYIVRIKTSSGFQLALVDLSLQSSRA